MALHTLDLSGRVALVTGGSRGIGRAIAIAMGHAGADVAVNCRERLELAEEVVGTIRSAGRRAIAVAANVSLQLPVRELVGRVERELGPVDILVNNAGTAVIRSIDELDEAEFDRTVAVNLKSAFLCTQRVLPGMRARQWGRIVNISSAAARGPGIVGVHYNATKAGLEGLTRGYAAHLAKDGITANAIAPGPTDTEMAAPLKEAGFSARIPIGRFTTADEVAQAVLMVIGNASITGQTVAVNGGMLFS
jgi:3-oxoacyl-[acyl-carrier protein] reductase